MPFEGPMGTKREPQLPAALVFKAKTDVVAYGPTRKNLSLAPDNGTVAGLAVPTGVQVAPAPTVGLDCSVPPDGVQEITMLPPEIEADSLACGVLVGAMNELL